MTDELVSDLEADDAQQQESGEEGVEENKVKCVSGQSARVALINDLTALSDHTGARQHRFGSICNNTPDRKLTICQVLKIVLKQLKSVFQAVQVRLLIVMHGHILSVSTSCK